MKSHILLKYIKGFVSISGLFSLLLTSCNSNKNWSEKELLIHRFYTDNIKTSTGDRIFIAVISSNCQDCINTNVELINSWEKNYISITYLLDSNMANEILRRNINIKNKSVIVDANLFVKYGITEGRMLVMYANDGKLELIDLIPDGVKTYDFKY